MCVEQEKFDKNSIVNWASKRADGHGLAGGSSCAAQQCSGSAYTAALMRNAPRRVARSTTNLIQRIQRTTTRAMTQNIAAPSKQLMCVCVRARRNVCMQMSFRRHILFFWRTRTLGNKVCNLCGQQNVHTRASCVCVVVCEHMQIKMSTKIKVTEKKLVVTSKGTCAAGRG